MRRSRSTVQETRVFVVCLFVSHIYFRFCDSNDCAHVTDTRNEDGRTGKKRRKKQKAKREKKYREKCKRKVNSVFPTSFACVRSDCRSLTRELSAEREARTKRFAASGRPPNGRKKKENFFGMQSSVDLLMIEVTFKHFDTAPDFGWANRLTRHRLSSDRIKRRIIFRNEIINQFIARFAYAYSCPIYDSDRERNSSLFLLSRLAELPCGLCIVPRRRSLLTRLFALFTVGRNSIKMHLKCQ